MKYQATFDKEYQILNTEQRQAVDSTEGPVMVVAGPGTGKTQILALRICNILKQTDTQAYNILCLTFTEQGALEMKKRLMKFMGSDAYKVHIHTYHSFARKVISENPDHFDNYKLEAISDLESAQLIKEIIDEFDYDNSLFKVNDYSKYSVAGNLKSLYGTMKQEHWSPEYLKERIKDRLAFHKNDDPLLKYKRGNKNKGIEVGDLKINDYKKIEKKYNRSLAAIDTFTTYNSKMTAGNRYDFNDMIDWTIDALAKNDDIRLDYQEQYHYILADEFQDSNGSQMSILSLLVKDVDQPNLFVVGDDDQSIYRFQGANLENLADYQKDFNPKIIVLLNNYRSSRHIVESSKSVIDFNLGRLSKRLNFDKNFTAEGKHKDVNISPKLLQFENVIAEEAYVYNYIKEAQAEGRDLSQIAVLFKKHKISKELIKVLTKDNIPVNVKRKVDVLKVPYIVNIINVLELIAKLHNGDYRVDHLIPDYFNLPAFDIQFNDVYKIGRYLKEVNAAAFKARKEGNTDQKIITWTDVIFDSDHLNQAISEDSQIHYAIKVLQDWTTVISESTVQILFQKIIEDGGFLNDALTACDNYWKLELLNTLFDFIKDEAAKTDHYKLKDLITHIRLMEENEIALSYLDIISDAGGVQFATCHGAKGMEFDTVIMLGSSKSTWKKINFPGAVTLPPLEDIPMSKTEADEYKDQQNQIEIEESRRLYYVAMTRAKKELIITYGVRNTETSGKPTEPVQFSAELIDATDVEMQDKDLVTKEIISDYQGKRMQLPKVKKRHWIDKSMLNHRLENYVMNITHVNKYLRCPVTFYFEVILHIPSARTDNMGYGNAMHYALEKHIKQQFKHGPDQLPLEQLYKHYTDGLNKFSSHFQPKDLENFQRHGKENLERYYNKYKAEWSRPNDMKFEIGIKNVVINDVPMQGNIDRLDIYNDHVEVFDYKTGTLSSSKKFGIPPEEAKGNYDQWRQVIAYNLLINASPDINVPMTNGTLDYVDSKVDEPPKRKEVKLNQESLDHVANEIKEVYDNINAHNFEPGCGKEDCRWCNFVEAEYGDSED
jgi:DNA helicase-2/ATP-dependent DNA helicase PcrA